VSIRGSESLLDWVVDVQLWLGAALAQMIRGVIPLGWVWTPILDDLVYLVNSVESDNLKKVSYYTTTTQFINDVLSGDYGDGNYTSLRVTGASLGGGLAIISGAQTNTTTVALSGLNAMLSRRTFDPPISKEALDTHVFNVIPDRDPVAHVDDPGRLFQRTECRAPKNSFFGCHSMWRSICELSHKCGSMNRPVLCWCVSKYGYPEPIQNGTRSFSEVCPPDPETS
jgi:lipase ATG15